MCEILDLFEEYDTDVICVSDFGIQVLGTTVTHIKKDGNTLSIWTGAPDSKYAEELILNNMDKHLVLEEILENF